MGAGVAWPSSVRIARIDLDDASLDAGRAVLCDDERERADRFATARLRARYERAHIGLRQRLALATGVAPTELRFEVNHYGKPSLASDELDFNLSHSEGVALVAISDRYDVGIDIELLKPIDDLPALARSQLSAREWAQWSALPDALRLPAFLRGWTRKEAILKALGIGLGIEARDVDMGLAPDDAPRLDPALVRDRLGGDCPHLLGVYDVPQPDGALATLALYERLCPSDRDACRGLNGYPMIIERSTHLRADHERNH